jgi:NAD(P)-dependent dehydrogenase (short-subunit alcohol dehydrogenase family)
MVTSHPGTRAPAESATPRARVGPELLGQTVVVIGGSAGIGLATAQRARAAGADVVVTGRDEGRLKAAAADLEAVGSAAFDATDVDALHRFLDSLPPVDHLMVAAGRPYYAPLEELDFARAERDVAEHIWLPIRVARHAAQALPPGGTVLLIGGTGARRPARGMVMISTMTMALPALTQALALEIAPVRVNLIACGFVDTPLSASLLGDHLDERRDELRRTLPIRRVVDPDDVGALAVHLMANTALTGATYDIDGGQQLLSS